MNRGGQPEDHAGDQRDSEREGQHPQIHRDLVEPRDGDGGRSPDDGNDGPGDGDAAGRAEDREDHTFDEKLAHQAHATGAERSPDRHLAFARDGLRQLQIGDVGASEQQQESDRSEEQPELAANVFSDDRVGEAFDPAAPLPVRLGIQPRQLGRDADHVRVGLRDADAGLEPTEGEQQVVAAIRRRIGGERDPEVARNVAVPFRHHARDSVGNAVEIDRLSHHRRVAAEEALPDALAEEDDVRVAARLVLLDPVRRAGDRALAEE